MTSTPQLSKSSSVEFCVSRLDDRHPQVLELVVERISGSGDRKYLPFLRRWKDKASRRLSRQIKKAIEALHQLS